MTPSSDITVPGDAVAGAGRRRSGFDRSAWLLIALAAVVLGIIAAYTATSVYHGREDTRRSAERELAALALSLARQTEITVRSLDVVVSLAAANVAAANADQPYFESNARAMFRQLLEAIPFVATVSYIDADGSVLVHSHERNTRGVSLADRSHFRVHQQRPDAGLFIGETFSPRMGEKRRRIAFTRRVNTPDGHFAGVVAATMFVDDFTAFFRTVKEIRGTSAALLRDDGVLIASHPDIPGMYERSHARTPLMQQFRQAPTAGHLYAPDDLQGGQRLLSYRAAEGTRLLVSVSLEEDELLADWRASAWRFASAGAASALAVMVLFGLALQQQRKAERHAGALAVSEERLRLVMDNVPAMIAYYDDALVCRLANRSYLHFYGGGAAGQLVGRPLQEIIGAPAAEQVASHLETVLAGSVARYEGERRDAQGALHVLDTVLVPDIGADGKAKGLYAMLTDITERKRAEQELARHRDHLEELVLARTRELEAAKDEAERASKAKSEFLSRMSHELRTPMNAILGFAQVLQIGSALSPAQRGFVEEIHRAGEHLLELIVDLLDLSRIEAGRLVTVVQPTSLQAVVDEAVRIVRPLLSERGITLLNKCDDAPHVLADMTRLRQILVNLLSNAIKYNRPGGNVTIECRSTDDDQLAVAVSDTGPGIAPEKLDQLFRPFERLGAESSGVDGAGIGLALSRLLAEMMGGELGVESTLGQGSTFWLKVAKAKIVPTPTVDRSRRESPEIGHVNVLYVEDNVANLRVIEALFERIPNMHLLTATRGESGIELARLRRPDVVLLDIHLPGMDGFEVLDALKGYAETAAIPVIALSADAMPTDVERAMSAGFTRYLTKPVKLEELIAAVQAVIVRAGVASA